MEFDKQNVRYCFLRNYEFLLDPKELPGRDFDLTIQKEDLGKAEDILKKFKFTRTKQQFSLKHRGFRKYISELQKSIGFDIQDDGIQNGQAVLPPGR